MTIPEGKRVALVDAVTAGATFRSLENINKEQHGRSYVSINDRGQGVYQFREYSSKIGLLWDKFLHAIHVRGGTLYSGREGMEKLSSKLRGIIQPVLENSEGYVGNVKPEIMKTAHAGLKYLSNHTDKGEVIFGELIDSMEKKLNEADAISQKQPSDRSQSRELKEKIRLSYSNLFALDLTNKDPIKALEQMVTNPTLLSDALKTCDQKITEHKRIKDAILNHTTNLDRLTNQYAEVNKECIRLSKVIEAELKYLEVAPNRLSTKESELEIAEKEASPLFEELNSIQKKIEELTDQKGMHSVLRQQMQELRDKQVELSETYTLPHEKGQQKKKDLKKIKDQLEVVNEAIKDIGMKMAEMVPLPDIEDRLRDLRARQTECAADYGRFQQIAFECKDEIGEINNLISETEKKQKRFMLEISDKEDKLQLLNTQIQLEDGLLKESKKELEAWKESTPLTADELKTQRDNLNLLTKATNPDRVSEGEEAGSPLSEGTVARVVMAIAKKEGFSKELNQAIYYDSERK
jgi:chromosome segregation ATPase